MGSACNRSCAGTAWVDHMLRSLQKAPQSIQQLVLRAPKKEKFRFGNGGTLLSSERVRVVIKNQVVLVWISVAPCDTLGCLLGKDFSWKLWGR